MRFKVGDKVLINSEKWYFENRDNTIKHWVNLPDGTIFGLARAKFCGQVMTIEDIRLDRFNTEYYILVEDEEKMQWNDYMIECKVEEEDLKPKFKIGDRIYSKYHKSSNDLEIIEIVNMIDGNYAYRIKNHQTNKTYLIWGYEMSNYKLVEEEISIKLTGKAIKNDEMVVSADEYILPEGYIFKDENGNIINAQKIVLEKKIEYPKTYEECCKVLGLSEFEYNHTGTKVWYRHRLMATLDKLMLCRDAYWKIAGEEMKLGEPWEPDYENPDIDLYVIINSYNQVHKEKYGYGFPRCIFTFPTAEMRDAFYEAFKEDFEKCKELL